MNVLNATPETDPNRARIALAGEVTLERHRRGDDPFAVAKGYANLVDGILEDLFRTTLGPEAETVALVAVGGYGREELAPYSDIDLLFLRAKRSAGNGGVEKLVRLLWDAGFHLGHAVRTPEECYGWMVDDASTAAALLEARFLCGDPQLYERLLSSTLWRFRQRRQRRFVAEQLRLLSESLGDPARTIYVIEPRLKDGACGLRDIQRVRWIENVRRRGSTFEAMIEEGRLPLSRLRAVAAAYAFYMRVRAELHYVNRVRMDILERDSQAAVAHNLGYAEGVTLREAVEALMGDYYRHSRVVYRFLRYYVERKRRSRSVFGRLTRKLLTEQVTPYLTLFRGWLYVAGEPPKKGSPEEILEMFRAAQTRDARLSESACEWIRRRVEMHDGDYTHSGQAMRSFLAVVRHGKNVGRFLKTMHETGVLRRILPEFGKLDCLVSFDGHHHFTVDEHTLKSLEELDRIEVDPNYRESEFRRVYLEIGNPLPLRLALLLHDIGKAFGGDHAVRGSELTLLICDRLGLDEATADTVEFLVYRHLELFKVSESRDLNESSVIEALARLVESEERLKMLYLLTYIDIKSVGPGTWTRWKGVQLTDVYQKTLVHLRTGRPPQENLDEALAASGLDAPDRERVLAHCRKIDTPGYNREILPERMLCHVELVDRLRDEAKLQIAWQSFGEYHEITFCAWDRQRLFMDLTGLLFSEGFDVLGARIFSRTDGVALDQFFVEIADNVRLGVEKRVERMQSKVEGMRNKTLCIGDIIRQRTLNYRVSAWSKPLYGPRIIINNESSDLYTLVEVNAADRPGLLFDLATGFSYLGLDVRMAKVSTFGERVHDTFYVLEEGGKVDNPARRQEIELDLLRRARRPGRILRGGT